MDRARYLECAAGAINAAMEFMNTLNITDSVPGPIDETEISTDSNVIESHTAKPAASSATTTKSDAEHGQLRI